MRAAVVGALEALSDRSHQDSVWLDRQSPSPGYIDNLDLNIHVLYDDVEVLPDPASRVGSVITDEEVQPLRELGAVLDPLIDELGDSPDADYLRHPGWPAVVQAAATALELLRKTD